MIPALLPDSWTAWLTIVSSTVSRSSVEPTAWLTSPSARSSPTDRVSSRVPRPQPPKHPRVRVGAPRLVGERLEELDLPVREGPRLDTAHRDRPDRGAVPDHRDRHDASERGDPGEGAELVVGIGLDV